MKKTLVIIALGAGFLLSCVAYADPPAGATAECKDGTYYTGTSHQGACHGHQGVKTWLDNGSSSGGSSTSSGSSSSGASTSSSSGKSKPSSSSGAAATSTSSSGTPPAGAIAKCKDGTYYSGTSHQGACRGHQGVAEWLDKGSSTSGGSATSKTTTTPAPTPAPAPAPKPAPATTSTSHAPTPSSEIQQKAGGGPGLVWVNSESKVYHCSGDQWYGKTKEGSYMSEAAAKAAGNRAAGGKECGG